RVQLAPALAARASPEDTVFILARPAQGPRMPLAVLRKQVKDLPLAFTLDDTMAMAPGATISSHARVVVSARISKSGDAMPRPGDLSGQSDPVAPGATGIELRISEVVK
ncbi:MAG: c-type cytochrome biogenesis protein CcmI, partial [Chitinophagaceae bacterium]|nr:c-type cytochrome biogenesis protein CcmI [Rubrivivax sp.]